MHVILARHGNTFELGARTVWIGARTDLPLTSKGREQATQIGEALKKSKLVPIRTLTGPLKRTVETASLTLAAAGMEGSRIEVDERLREIDYGDWEGKSSDEIRKSGQGEELRAWDEYGTWPLAAGWRLPQAGYLQSFLSVLDSVFEAGDSPTLIVSSNGLFKIFATSILARKDAKMGTGHLSALRLNGVGYECLCWNQAPFEFATNSRERW